MKVEKGTCSICGEETDVVRIDNDYICYGCACEVVSKLEDNEDEDEGD